MQTTVFHKECSLGLGPPSPSDLEIVVNPANPSASNKLDLAETFVSDHIIVIRNYLLFFHCYNMFFGSEISI